jgi:sRNA-binding protein
MTASKQDYLKEMEQILRLWAERIEELTAESKHAKPEKQHELQSLIDAIVENKNFIEMQMKAILSSDQNWFRLKDGIEGAAKNLDESYRSALAYIM